MKKGWRFRESSKWNVKFPEFPFFEKPGDLRNSTPRGIEKFSSSVKTGNMILFYNLTTVVWFLRFLYSSTLVLCHPEPPRLCLFFSTTLLLLFIYAVFWFCVKSYRFSLALENRGKFNIYHKFLTREHFGWLDMRCQRMPLKTLDCTWTAHRPIFYQISLIFWSKWERFFKMPRRIRNFVQSKYVVLVLR